VFASHSPYMGADCSCDAMAENPSTCNLSCDAYSSSYCLHKLSINRYSMDNIRYLSDHILKKITYIKFVLKKEMYEKLIFHWYSPNMFTCFTMYTIDVNIQSLFIFNVTLFTKFTKSFVLVRPVFCNKRLR